MKRLLLFVVAATVILLGGYEAAAHAMDRPIDGTKLVIARSRFGGEILFFVSRDAGFLFPWTGSADDPVTGDPGGARLDLFSRNGAQLVSFDLPAGGWMPTRRRRSLYKFVNRDAPHGISEVRVALLRAGRGLVVVARATGLTMAGSQAAVGVRLTTGRLRNCARFAGRSVKWDRANLFIGRDAPASALADCSDASLGGGAPGTTTSTTSSTTSSTSTTSSSTTTLPSGTTYGNDVEFPGASYHGPDFLLGSPVTLPAPSTLTHLSLISKSSGQQVVMSLYSDHDGIPSALVASTPVTPVTVGVMEIPVSPTSLTAGTYWIMGLYDVPASIGLDESDTTAVVTYTEVPFTSPLPDPYTAASQYFGQRFNYYFKVLE